MIAGVAAAAQSSVAVLEPTSGAADWAQASAAYAANALASHALVATWGGVIINAVVVIVAVALPWLERRLARADAKMAEKRSTEAAISLCLRAIGAIAEVLGDLRRSQSHFDEAWQDVLNGMPDRLLGLNAAQRSIALQSERVHDGWLLFRMGELMDLLGSTITAVQPLIDLRTAAARDRDGDLAVMRTAGGAVVAISSRAKSLAESLMGQRREWSNDELLANIRAGFKSLG